MLIRIMQQMSGSMADGRNWPEYLGLTEVTDQEGFDLVRAEIAAPGDNFAADRLAEMGLEAPVPAEPEAAEEPAGGDAEPAAEEAEPAAAASPPEAAAVPPAEAGGAGEAGPPPPSANKQEWVDYAVAQGADVHEASAMTKADLMSRYGGRL